jgi:hypothetical protein
LHVLKKFRWESIFMIEQSSIFFRARVSVVNFSILFLDRARIIFSRFMISESTQNEALSLTRAEIEIEILTSICWRKENNLISRSMLLRLRLVFDAEEDCLEDLVDENDCLDSISVFLILLLRDDEILLHVFSRVRLMRFLTIFSKLNDEKAFEKFTKNREFIFFLFVFILRCFFFLISHLRNQTMWSMMSHTMHVWIFFESTCEQLSMLCFFAHCSHVT